MDKSLRKPEEADMELHFKKLEFEGIDLADQGTIENVNQNILALMYPNNPLSIDLNKNDSSLYTLSINFKIEKNEQEYKISFNDLANIYSTNLVAINDISIHFSQGKFTITVKIWKMNAPIKHYIKKKTLIKTVIEDSSTNIILKKRKTSDN